MKVPERERDQQTNPEYLPGCAGSLGVTEGFGPSISTLGSFYPERILLSAATPRPCPIGYRSLACLLIGMAASLACFNPRSMGNKFPTVFCHMWLTHTRHLSVLSCSSSLVITFNKKNTKRCYSNCTCWSTLGSPDRFRLRYTS